MQRSAHKKSHSTKAAHVTDTSQFLFSSRKITQLLAIGVVLATSLSFTIDVSANERDRYKRVYDRLAGVPPTADEMSVIMAAAPADRLAEASNRAMANPSFYNVTLKNFASPWTNEAQSVFFPLNDYSATVIGLIRDGEDYRQVLYEDVIYTSNNSSVAPYSNTNNQHYLDLENNNLDLSQIANLNKKNQSTVTGLAADATAGIMTSRAAARAYLVDGTNRALFRFTLLNHLCYDMEQLKDNTRTADRIRQDVSRSPGGDSRIFFTNCLACHAGMDPLVQAFAYYEWGYKDINPDEPDIGRLLYSGGATVDAPGTVQPKYHINANNFKGGYITPDNRWSNYWRKGPNAWLGWAAIGSLPSGHNITIDAKGVSHGYGAKSLGMELAHSDAFARCQVKKAFQTVCLRSPDNREDTVIKGGNGQFDSLVTTFKAAGNMKDVFKGAAVYCATESGL